MTNQAETVKNKEVEVVYQRIKSLCDNEGITIVALESKLGLGNSSINKWAGRNAPSAKNIAKVAKYFDVSIEYLLGETDISATASNILQDEAIISIQRARERMTPVDKEKSLQLWELTFGYAFKEEDAN